MKEKLPNHALDHQNIAKEKEIKKLEEENVKELKYLSADIIRSDYKDFLNEDDFTLINKKIEQRKEDVELCLSKYKELNEPKPKFLPFLLGYLWYNSRDNKNDYLSVVDFSMGDNSQRLYLINMKTNKVEANTTCMQWEWKNWEQTFSNKSWTWQSSLGLAQVPVSEKEWNPRSYHPEKNKGDENLLLRWAEPGFNDNIFNRKIYMHTWDRSKGCFTLPQDDLWHEVIKKMAYWGTIMSFYPNANYLRKTILWDIR